MTLFQIEAHAGADHQIFVGERVAIVQADRIVLRLETLGRAADPDNAGRYDTRFRAMGFRQRIDTCSDQGKRRLVIMLLLRLDDRNIQFAGTASQNRRHRNAGGAPAKRCGPDDAFRSALVTPPDFIECAREWSLLGLKSGSMENLLPMQYVFLARRGDYRCPKPGYLGQLHPLAADHNVNHAQIRSRSHMNSQPDIIRLYDAPTGSIQYIVTDWNATTFTCS